MCLYLCYFLQRLGRENAALLERAGVDDDVRDLGTSDLNNLSASPSSSQQLQQLPGGDASPSEIAVEALSVVDMQQQQQQEEEEEEDEPLPPELQGLSEMLEGVADWQEKQERMRAALRRAGGWVVV